MDTPFIQYWLTSFKEHTRKYVETKNNYPKLATTTAFIKINVLIGLLIIQSNLHFFLQSLKSITS
jgi:hypothetical protein